ASTRPRGTTRSSPTARCSSNAIRILSLEMQSQSPAPEEVFLVSAHTDSGDRSRTFGWLPTDDAARSAIERNVGGMDEAVYSWLCLEAFKQGIFAASRVVAWYRWVHPDGVEGAWQLAEEGPAWARD